MNIKKMRKSVSNMFRMDSILENKLILSSLKHAALHSTEHGITSCTKVDKPIIVSLTTYGKKIYEVYLVVESIFQQTAKPNSVVLWLSEAHFTLNDLPLTLRRQIDRGLDVRFCKDIRSYTKLVYSIKEYKGYHIITVDDDIIYPFDMIENFIVAYQKDSKKIYFNKGHEMMYDVKNKTMKPYIDWCNNGYVQGSSLRYLPLGVYGVFYPDGILHNDVIKEEIFLDISPTADDIWFKAMSLLNKIECQSISQGAFNINNFISIELDREKALARTNVDQGANDWQIQKVFEQYNLYEFFKNEARH